MVKYWRKEDRLVQGWEKHTSEKSMFNHYKKRKLLYVKRKHVSRRVEDAETEEEVDLLLEGDND